MPQQLHVSRYLMLAKQLPELCQNHKQQVLSCKENCLQHCVGKENESSLSF